MNESKNPDLNPKEKVEEKNFSLRPKSIDEVNGQTQLNSNLNTFIK